MAKDDGAFLTIGELAQQLGVAQHILRYWETRFPQLKPLQRSGNRRYYRPRDVEIAQQINRLLHDEGFTVKGAQRMLAGKKEPVPAFTESAPAPALTASERTPAPELTPAPSAPAAAPRANGPQGELPIGELPLMTNGAGHKPRDQVTTSDLALLIARLTVIRQTLVDALDAG